MSFGTKSSGRNEKLAIGQGKVRQKHAGEKDPPSGEVEASHGIGEPAVAQDHKGGDSKRVAQKHDCHPCKISDQGVALAQTIPIHERHECEQIVKEVDAADT